MRTLRNLPVLLATLVLLTLAGCSKDDEVSPKNKQVMGDWYLDSIYKGGQNVTSQYRDINNWIDDSYLWIDEDVADEEGPYFQCFVVSWFAEGTDANHNEGKWDVKDNVLILDGYQGKLQAKINKINSEELHLEVDDEGVKLEYRFSK